MKVLRLLGLCALAFPGGACTQVRDVSLGGIASARDSASDAGVEDAGVRDAGRADASEPDEHHDDDDDDRLFEELGNAQLRTHK